MLHPVASARRGRDFDASALGHPGLRSTVQDFLESLASGMTGDEVPADFPERIREDIQACVSFAADRERKLSTAAA